MNIEFISSSAVLRILILLVSGCRRLQSPPFQNSEDSEIPQEYALILTYSDFWGQHKYLFCYALFNLVMCISSSLLHVRNVHRNGLSFIHFNWSLRQNCSPNILPYGPSSQQEHNTSVIILLTYASLSAKAISNVDKKGIVIENQDSKHLCMTSRLCASPVPHSQWE